MKSQPANKRSKKPKILYVITQGTWGGAQRYVFDLATRFANDFDITVAVGEPYGQKDLQQMIDHFPTIKLVKLKHLVRNVSPIHDLLAIFELKKLYKTLRPNIVHLNSSKAGILGALATFNIQPSSRTQVEGNSKFKIIYTVHGWVFNEPLSFIRKKLYLALERFTAIMKDGVIVLSNRDKKTAIQTVRVKKEKTWLIPLGIPEIAFPSREKAQNILREKTDIDAHTYIVGTIANLYKTKGLDVLVEAIRQKKDAFENTAFVIVGEGPERARLENLINEYDLSNIHLIGSVDDAARLLPAFDLFVLPSRKEGLPYTLLEVAHEGLPWIATNVGGIAELAEKFKTGRLVESGNPQALGEAIQTLLKKKPADRRVIPWKESPYSIDRMIDKTHLLYKNLLQRQD